MYFEQIRTPGLGCFSYILGCPRAGLMAVVDPRRDVEIYRNISKKHDMRISYIFETHVHADHVSGAQDLQALTGAPIYIHESAPIEYNAIKVRQNDIFEFGAVAIRVLHTPGHTPNSISLLVSDITRSQKAEMLLTGDLLFVGDVGRPDLPGEEIMNEQVQNLFSSLHNVLGDLPDGLELYPAHGQGSLCGRGMSGKPYSTLGYERIANPMMQINKFEDFKTNIMANLPMRPQSFSHIIATNLKGATLSPACDAENKALPAGIIDKLQQRGAYVLDLRTSLSYSSAHIPGSINIDISEPSAINWIGTVVPPGSPIVLITENDEDFTRMYTELRRIGYDDVKGYLLGGIQAWINKGKDIEHLPQMSAHSLKQALSEKNPPLIIDVRTKPEFLKSRLPNSLHLPFDELLSGSVCPGEPEQDKVVVCQAGYRSSIAASILQAKGCKNIHLLAGGLELLYQV